MSGATLTTAVPAALAAYLVGAIPFGWLLGRWSGGVDVRRVGSGNIGATNVGRFLGIWAGILTLALDVGKGSAAVWGAWRLSGQAGVAMVSGLAALAGHVFPVYLGFRGGKGVATGLGAFLVLEPAATLYAGAVFLGVLILTRRVSPGSILAAASLPLVLFLRGDPPALIATGLGASLLIIIRHRDNIRRLLSGQEPRLGAGK